MNLQFFYFLFSIYLSISYSSELEAKLSPRPSSAAKISFNYYSSFLSCSIYLFSSSVKVASYSPCVPPFIPVIFFSVYDSPFFKSVSLVITLF